MHSSGLWAGILAVAKWTPSPHNTQPWKVRVTSEHRADLYFDPARTLPDEDVTLDFLHCAMGMFVECVEIAAANRGFELGIQFENLAPHASLIPFASLTLSPFDAARGDYSDEQITQRRTSRLPSLPEALPDEIVERFRRIAEPFGQRVEIVEDTGLVEQIVGEDIEALFHDLNHAPYRNEIATWYRKTTAYAEQQRDGLDYRCMNMRGIDMWASVNLHSLLRMPILRSLFRWHYRKKLGHVQQIAVLSGPYWAPKASMRAGRFFMKLWLEMSVHGLYPHPFGNLVTRKESRSRLEALLGIPDIWLIMRIGKTDDPPTSLRLESVLSD